MAIDRPILISAADLRKAELALRQLLANRHELSADGQQYVTAALRRFEEIRLSHPSWDHLKTISQDSKMERRQPFAFAELFSFILPPKAKREIFEPAFNDLKSDFLKARRKFKTNGRLRWLSFCFGLHVSLMVGSCFWVMCSERTKRLILRLVPDVIRRFWGAL